MTNPIDPRRVEYLPLTELVPDPKNPKAHDLETIDASIGRFGMLDTIVLDGRTGYIISGHGRRSALAAMEARGEAAPEGVKADPETGAWLVPAMVGWSSRTDTEAHAALIALNRTTELGGWVDDELLGLLDELANLDDDQAFVGVGFTEDDRAALEHLTYKAEDDGPRDLDELFETVGAPTEEDALVRVVLQLPADLAEQLLGMIGTTPDEHEAAAMRWIGELE